MFERKKVLSLFLLLCIFISSITGCARDATAASDSDDPMPVNNEIEPAEDIDMNVVLFVNQGWDEENNAKIPDAEYPLSGEDAKMVFELFYGHEKEVLDSPLMSIATLQFQVGEDYLSSSVDALNTLSGIIQGELVAIRLSEDECEALREIISPYTENIS